MTSQEKGSASSSIILFGKIKPTSKDVNHKYNMMIKMSFESLDNTDNSLDVEIAIYKNVITNLINHTPNLMAYLGDSVCDSNMKFPLEVSNVIQEEINNIDKSDNNIDIKRLLF